MSARTMWTVTVLKAVEVEIEVSAITEDDAREEALKELGVVRVVSVNWKDPDESV